MVFISRIILVDPKVTPPVYFSNFQAEENLLVLNFSRRLDEKWTAAALPVLEFCKTFSGYIFRIKT